MLLNAAPARAAFDPQAASRRIEALINQSGFLESAELLPPLPAAMLVAPGPVEMFPSQLWESLSPLDAQGWVDISSLDPAVDPARVREIPFDKADALMAEAVARGISALDFFSDAGLRGPNVYYFSSGTLILIYRKYNVGGLTLAEGLDDDGRPFHMRGALAGAGKVDIFYDLDDFCFANPAYPDHHYDADSRVTYTIRGDADLDVEGLAVDGFFSPAIKRLRKTGPGRMKVETSLVNRDRPLDPIQLLRPDGAASR